MDGMKPSPSEALHDEAMERLREFVKRRPSYPDDAVMMHMDNDDMIRMRHLRAIAAQSATPASASSELRDSLPEAARATSEFGWLLEAPSVDGPPDYWTGAAWSPNAFDAIRFARKDDAERFLSAHHRPIVGIYLHGGEIFVREHGFAAPLPSPKAPQPARREISLDRALNPHHYPPLSETPATQRSEAIDLLRGLHKVVLDLSDHFEKPITDDNVTRWLALNSAQAAVKSFLDSPQSEKQQGESDLKIRLMRKAEHAAEWQARAEQAERELAALRTDGGGSDDVQRDAERYRWLREHLNHGFAADYFAKYQNWAPWAAEDLRNLDAAIDAARGQEQGK